MDQKIFLKTINTKLVKKSMSAFIQSVTSLSYKIDVFNN